MIEQRKISNRKISKYKRKELSSSYTQEEVLRKIKLTQRDREVLMSLYWHRCLTTEQLADIHFKYDGKGKVNKQANLIARRRLRKMFDAHLVDRFFIDVGENNGSSQAHVVLDKLGARLVAGMLNMDVKDLNWRYEMNQNLLPYHSHTVKVNDFYLCLLKKARICRHEVVGFTAESHTRFEFEHDGRKVILNPDAYGQYWKGDEGIHFFLEMDNGTMSPSVFQKKHERYTAFYASEAYDEYYDTFPFILTVTTSRERALQLRDTICKVDNTDVNWYFASEDDVKRDPLSWIGKEDEKPLYIL